jgi:phage baseplate assembly protein W
MAEYEADVRQAIRIIIETRRGERVMRPEFGCGIHDLVFDVIDTSLLTRIETEVRESLLRYEARIDVLDVRADLAHAAHGTLLVEIEYRVRRTNQTGNFVFPFYFREGGSLAEAFRT